MMLGTTSFNKQHVPGNGPLDDNTIQREQTSYWLARQLKIPWSYRRYYILYVNGNRHGPLMEDSQVPGGDLLAEYFPNDSNGFLYKNNAWFEFEPNFNSNQGLGFNNNSWCTLNRYNTTQGGVSGPKLARYRWNYWMRQSPDSANNYTNVFALIDAANLPSGPAYSTAMESLVDIEEFMRMAALEHVTGDWDSFTTQNQWNMYSYKPTAGKWNLLKWDWNITLGSSGSWGPDAGNLFTVSGSDPNMNRFQSYPPFRRAYLRALSEVATGPLVATNVGAILDAKYAAFRANGLNSTFGVADPGAGGLKSWIATMRQSILSTLNNQGVSNIPFAATSETNQVVGDSTISLTGSAPLEAKDLWVNGFNANVHWTTTKAWSISVALPRATNEFLITAVDSLGQPLNLPPLQFEILNTNAPSSLNLPPRINEWMASNQKTILDPANKSSADWFEVFNPNASPLDLSGYFLSADSTSTSKYQVPGGTVIGPKGFLLIWADGGLSGANDGTNRVLHASFKLKKAGGVIGLFDPATNSVDSIRFGPQETDVSGGRFPDGGPLVYSLTSPTPSAPNQFSNSPPILAVIAPVQAHAGDSIRMVIQAVDPDAPPQSITYLLDSGGITGPAIDPVAGILTWPIDPLIADGSYSLTIQATDNGTPPRSTSQTVVVNLTGGNPTGISAAIPTLTGSTLTVSWSTRAGSRYRIQSTPSLGSPTWSDLPGDIIAGGDTASKSIDLSGIETDQFFRVILIP